MDRILRQLCWASTTTSIAAKTRRKNKSLLKVFFVGFLVFHVPYLLFTRLLGQFSTIIDSLMNIVSPTVQNRITAIASEIFSLVDIKMQHCGFNSMHFIVVVSLLL